MFWTWLRKKLLLDEMQKKLADINAKILELEEERLELEKVRLASEQLETHRIWKQLHALGWTEYVTLGTRPEWRIKPDIHVRLRALIVNSVDPSGDNQNKI